MDLNNFIVYYFTGIISILGLIIWGVLLLIDLQKNKKIRFTNAKTISGIVLLMLFYVSLPVLLCIFTYAVQEDPEDLSTDERAKSVALYDFAAKIAVVPRVKGEFYSLAGSEYMSLFDGKKALNCYKEAERYKTPADPVDRISLCILYFWNEDDKNIEKYCTAGPIAVNHIRNNDYVSALQVLNDKINKSGQSSGACLNYALRSYVYRKTGYDYQADSDYSRAVSLCPKNRIVRSYAFANDILDVYNGGREYGNKLKF